jgi:diadenosine tetraphosphate (Ap4A) HIT family hydrolase
MMNEPSCVFCQILQGHQQASWVYSDEHVVAFMDIRPVNEGHLLVVPRAHAAGLGDLDPQVGGHLFQVAMDLAAGLRRSNVRCEGVNLFLADGAAAGQEVFHVHLHVLPRFRGDGFGFRFGPHYGKQPSRATLDKVAGAIQRAMEE